MAFLCTENFDSYANGDNLSGKSGGSGWTTNWVSAGTGEITNAQAQSGTLSMLPDATTNPYRDFTNVTVGTLDFYFYIVSGDQTLVRLYNTGTALIYLKTLSNQVQVYNGVAYENVGAYSNATWTKMTIELDQTAQPYKARYRVGAGAFSSWISRAGNVVLTGVDRFLTFENPYYDSIAPGSATATTTTPVSTLSLLGCG